MGQPIADNKNPISRDSPFDDALRDRRVRDPVGAGLLLKGSFWGTLFTVATALIGIAALAGGVQNWFLRQSRRTEPIMLITAGLLLVYPVQSATPQDSPWLRRWC